MKKEKNSGEVSDKSIAMVLPICLKDAPLAVKLCRFIAKFTPKNKDKAIVWAAQNLKNGPYPAQCVELLSKVFLGGVEISYPSIVDERGGSYSPNNMFQQLVLWLEFKRKDIAGFLWMEPDTTPIVKSWWNELRDDYLASGQPFMGILRETIHAPTGQKRGHHMNGVGFYVQNPNHISPRIMQAQGIPWDVEAGPEMIGHLHDSQKMQVLFKTGGNGFSLADVRKGVVLFHGCKSGELIDEIVMKEGIDLEIPVEKEQEPDDSSKKMERIAKLFDTVVDICGADVELKVLSKDMILKKLGMRGESKACPINQGEDGREEEAPPIVPAKSLIKANNPLKGIL